jgi:hypothetical protein
MRIVHGLVLSALTAGMVACSLKGVERGATIVVRIEDRSEGPAAAQSHLGPIGPLSTPTLPPPPAVSGFDCLGVNVVGPGIPDTSMNPNPLSQTVLPDLLAGRTYCSYRGILAGPILANATTAQEVAFVVPPGSPRLIQIVGLIERNGSHDCVREFVNGPQPSSSPGVKVEADVFEIGRQVVDLTQDTTVTVSPDWNSLNPTVQLARTLKCGDGGGASPTPSIGSFTTLNAMTNLRTDFATFYDVRTSPKIHVIGGSPTTFGETYDISAGTWSFQGGSISPVGLAGSALVPIPGTAPGLMRLGGVASSTTQQINNGSWAASTAIPSGIVVGSSSPVKVPALAATFLFGGPSSSGQIIKSDHTTGAVTLLTPALSAGRNRASTALLSNGKILIAGGTNGTTSVTNCDLFDPSGPTVTTCASLPTSVFDGVLVPLAGGNALLIGGSTGAGAGTATSNVYFYNSTGDTWTNGPTLPAARTDAHGVVLGDGRVFVIGGRDAMGAAMGSTLLSASGGWTPGPNLAVARMAFGFERALDGTLYIIGGKDSGGASLNSMEHWVP